MFTKKNKSENSNSNNNNNENNNSNNQSTIKSWLSGRIGSLLIFSAVGYALYKFGIITKITKYFKKDKGKEVNRPTHTFTNPNEKSEQSTSNSNSPS